MSDESGQQWQVATGDPAESVSSSEAGYLATVLGNAKKEIAGKPIITVAALVTALAIVVPMLLYLFNFITKNILVIITVVVVASALSLVIDIVFQLKGLRKTISLRERAWKQSRLFVRSLVVVVLGLICCVPLPTWYIADHVVHSSGEIGEHGDSGVPVSPELQIDQFEEANINKADNDRIIRMLITYDLVRTVLGLVLAASGAFAVLKTGPSVMFSLTVAYVLGERIADDEPVAD